MVLREAAEDEATRQASIDAGILACARRVVVDEIEQLTARDQPRDSSVSNSKAFEAL